MTLARALCPNRQRRPTPLTARHRTGTRSMRGASGRSRPTIPPANWLTEPEEVISWLSHRPPPPLCGSPKTFRAHAVAQGETRGPPTRMTGGPRVHQALPGNRRAPSSSQPRQRPWRHSGASASSNCWSLAAHLRTPPSTPDGPKSTLRYGTLRDRLSGTSTPPCAGSSKAAMGAARTAATPCPPIGSATCPWHRSVDDVSAPRTGVPSGEPTRRSRWSGSRPRLPTEDVEMSALELKRLRQLYVVAADLIGSPRAGD
jgi:hypothetical protein